MKKIAPILDYSDGLFISEKVLSKIILLVDVPHSSQTDARSIRRAICIQELIHNAVIGHAQITKSLQDLPVPPFIVTIDAVSTNKSYFNCQDSTLYYH